MTRRYTRAEFEQVFNHMFGELLPGAVPQGVYELSATKRYKIGSRLAIDERVFHYARSGGVITPELGAKNLDPQHVCCWNTVAAAAAQGATTIVIDVTATNGILNDGAIAENELAGGWINIYDATGGSFVRRILSNTVTLMGVGGEMTLLLDQPIPVALIANTDHVEAISCAYRNVQQPAPANSVTSVVGVPAVATTAADQFLWVQTWGPTWLACQVEASVGFNNRNVVFRPDGSGDEFDTGLDAFTARAQHAGFVISNQLDEGRGSWFIFLQITP